MEGNLENEQSFKMLLKWLANERSAVYRIYFLALIQGLLYIAIPLGFQGVITYTMAGKFSASLILLSIITIVATFFIGVMQMWQMRLNETIQQRIFSQFVNKLNRFLDIDEHALLKPKLAHFFEIITLQKGVGKILLDFSFSIISIIFGLLLLPAYNTWFLIFSVFLSIAFYLIVSFYGKKAQNANIKISSRKYLLYTWLEEAVNTNGKDDAKTDALLFNYLKSRKDYFKTFESQYKGILVFKVLFVGILLLLGSYLVQIGELNIGQFVASEIIVLLMINSIEKLVSSLETCYEMVTGIYKIELMFGSKPELSYLNSEPKVSLPSLKTIYNHQYDQKIKVVFYSILISTLVILFLPWTQSVDLKGKVSVLNPENKPQTVTSRIAGRVERWYINDGDLVKKNDTIAFISEIKDEYIDPKLIERSESQIKSKEVAMQSYEGKINSIESQIDAINKGMRLKIEQIKNKMIQGMAKSSSDSIEAISATNNLKVAEEQYKRYEELLQKGVISKTDFENRKVKVQDALAKKISSENKLYSTKNELLNTELELSSARQDYNEKLMKSESDKFSTLSMFYDAEGSLTKLQNQLSNYSLRKSYYYVLAPQDGHINHIAIKGVGEIIKEGGILCNIVPLHSEQVVELYLDPVDLPLIRKGQEIQLIFDGWPTFVFSGWPGVSYGAFSAKIVAFDKVISENGKFRVLASNTGKPWPSAIQIGGGAEGFALLSNVPLVYDLWRKLNGFPPEFYQSSETSKNKKDAK